MRTITHIAHNHLLINMKQHTHVYKHPHPHVSMATNTTLPSTLRVHPWLPTHHSKYTWRTSMATNTSLQVQDTRRTSMAGYQHITPRALGVHPWLPTHHSKYTHGYQHLTPSTTRHSAYIHGWLQTHHSKNTLSTPMATNTSLQIHLAYTHGYQHLTPSTLRVHPWLPTHHSIVF